MRPVYPLIFLLLNGLVVINANSAQREFDLLQGPYIGQNPPGLTPEVFAPGIVSKEHRDWTGRFTPDMHEYYFTRNNKKSRTSTTIVFKLENDLPDRLKFIIKTRN